MAKEKNESRVSAGRKGGQAKVPKGLARMSAKRRKAIQSAGGRARWAKG